MKTEQEIFWEGDFGNQYTNRNNEELIINNVSLFKTILKNISINSIFEIGFNRGLNLLALNQIDKNILLNGLEINN